MKKTITLLSLALLSFNSNWAQAPSIQWKNHYGGSGADNAKSVCKTSDGGYVVVGFTESNDIDAIGQHGTGAGGTRDILAVKTNSLGVIVWKRVLGGTANDEILSVIQKSDGSILMAGYSESNNGDFTISASLPHRGAKDVLVMNLDNASGSIIWSKKYGGSSNEEARVIREDASGNIFVAGYSLSNDFDLVGSGIHLNTNGSSPTNDYWVLKLNTNGLLTWQKCYGGTSDGAFSDGDDFANTLVITASGDPIISGFSNSVDGDVSGAKGGRDFWTVKANGTNGTIIWQKNYGGSNWEEARGSDLTTTGDVLITGYTQSNDADVTGLHGGAGGNKDIWVIKINQTTGSLITQKCLGGNSAEESYDIKSTSDGGFIICGYSASASGDAPSATNSNGDLMTGWDWWIPKLDASFNLTWQKKLGGQLTELGGYSIVEAIGGGYVVAGIASNFFEGPSGTNYALEDYFLVKLGMVSGVGIKKNDELTFKTYPNPTKGKFVIELKENITNKSTLEIVNAIGQVIFKNNIEGMKIEINIENEPTGIYIIRITSDNNTITEKIIKE